jgi:hypothetical protein
MRLQMIWPMQKQFEEMAKNMPAGAPTGASNDAPVRVRYAAAGRQTMRTNCSHRVFATNAAGWIRGLDARWPKWCGLKMTREASVRTGLPLAR